MIVNTLIQHNHSNSGKMVLQALIRFIDLKDIVLFTCKANPGNTSFDDDYSEIVKENFDYYQRRIDIKRLNQIESFIRQCILSESKQYSITALFPTSLILAVNEEDGNTIIEQTDSSCEIKLEDNIFIVDGQHRMMAMKSLYERLLDSTSLTNDDRTIVKYLQEYKFNCVLLVNYDLWEQGQVFVNVNFKQKPVNKSLYYEIFGSHYNDDPNMWKQNHIFLAHNLTRVLNENEESPYFQKIKMIGTGSGYISQASFVESLIRQFSLNGIWSIYDNNRNSDGNVRYMAVELLSYFVAVKDAFKKYWPDKNNVKGTIICKTTGTGAFVRLMSDIRNEAPKNVIDSLYKEYKKNEVYISEEYRLFAYKKFKQIDDKKAESLFGSQSTFSGISGKGSEVKMYKELRSAIFSDRQMQSNTDLPFSPDDVAEQLQEFLWVNIMDDLDCLAYHYEYEELSDLNIESYTENEKKYFLKVSFTSGLTIYIDNEDQTGFAMSFPSRASLVMEKVGDKWEMDKKSVKASFDTTKYYE
ncbi:MAG: DGQHR domain-containing protein [Bacteroidetes bacterium]|uniref:DGQHR domain-containing protein n=1 Tax=Candidatus Cryptobacteroides avicola TaxID=2840757 RepID=A0A940DTP3_9BACT|nr:DGQHR domain-containing protein [Candidatus Cryptobacteroides avicola]